MDEGFKINEEFFDRDEFTGVSDECKELLMCMLNRNPKKRITSVQALKHPWFAKMKEFAETTSPVRVPSETLRKMSSFRGGTAFKKAALNLLVKSADEREVEHLRQQFQMIDKDGNGMIEAQELQKLLVNMNLDKSDQEVQEIIEQMDYNNNGQINYSEFLAATIDVHNFLTESRLRAAFSQFDTDQSGKITKENIKLALAKMSKIIDEDELENIINQHDKDGNGMLDFEEFKQIFKEEQITRQSATK